MHLHGDEATGRWVTREQGDSSTTFWEPAPAPLGTFGRMAAAIVPAPPAVQVKPIASTGTAPRKTPAPEAVKWDDESVRAAVGPDFSAAVYFRNNPDVAADSWASQNPERHWLAYGMAEGRPFPMPDTPPPAVQVKTVYQAPNPPAPLDLFPKVQATPVATPAPSSPPVVAQPMTPTTPPLPQPAPSGPLPSPTAWQTLAPSAPAPAPAAGSSLPSWAMPAAIGAAALVVAVPLLSRKRRS